MKMDEPFDVIEVTKTGIVCYTLNTLSKVYGSNACISDIRRKEKKITKLSDGTYLIPWIVIEKSRQE